MKTVIIIFVIFCGFALLLAVSVSKSKSAKKKRVRKKAKTLPPDPRVPTKKTIVPKNHESVAMSPKNPRWAKIYVEEMAKNKTDETTRVIKKWLREK